MVKCDRCDSNLSHGEGYAVWSEAKSSIGADMKIQWGIAVTGIQSTAETGGMLLCNKCADTVFTDSNWEKATTAPIIVADDGNMRELKDAQIKANNYGIAVRAKRRGLTSAQARSEAREIALLFWKDNAAAVHQLKAQATNTSARGSSHISARSWWQFWK